MLQIHTGANVLCLEESREAACCCCSLVWLGGQPKPMKQLFFQLVIKKTKEFLNKQTNKNNQRKKQTKHQPSLCKSSKNSPACFLTYPCLTIATGRGKNKVNIMMTSPASCLKLVPAYTAPMAYVTPGGCACTLHIPVGCMGAA